MLDITGYPASVLITFRINHLLQVFTNRSPFFFPVLFYKRILRITYINPLPAIIPTHFNADTSSKNYPSISELNLSRNIKATPRAKGTVQACTWQLKEITDNRKNNRLFVVVTRTDTAWGKNEAAEKEPYALAVCLSDKEGQNVRLYTQVRNALQVKVRQRVRL